VFSHDAESPEDSEQVLVHVAACDSDSEDEVRFDPRRRSRSFDRGSDNEEMPSPQRPLTDREKADHIRRKINGPYILHPISGKMCCNFCPRTYDLNRNSDRLKHEREVHFFLKRIRDRKKRHAYCIICNFGPSHYDGPSKWNKKHYVKDDFCREIRETRGITITKENANSYVRIFHS